MDMLTSLAVLMLSGMVMTFVCKKLHLPNVTGYLVAGLIAGPSFLNIMTSEMLESMKIVTTIALAFIAFSIGGEFKISNIKKIGSSATIITMWQGLAAVILVTGALIIFGYPIPMALTLGAISAATAPAATLMVVRQYKAKGPLTNLLLPIVALDDAVGLIVFAVSFGIAKTLVSGNVDMIAIIVNPLVEIVCSLGLGAIMGWFLTQLEKMFNSNTNRLNMTITFVFLTVALSMLDFHIGQVHISFSSLLVCMMLGTVFCNICPLSHDLMEKSDKWTSPLFALFFVISGAELELSVFTDVAIVVVGIVYIIFRSLGKYFGSYASAKAVKCEPSICKYLGITLLPQAGVALGMCSIAASATEMAGQGALIRNITLFAVLIYEIFGPVMTREALKAAGDIKPMSEEVKMRRHTKLEDAKNRNN